MNRYHSLTLEPINSDRLNQLCGALDQNLRVLEEAFAVTISARGHCFNIKGSTHEVTVVKQILQDLYAQTAVTPVTLAHIQQKIQQMSSAQPITVAILPGIQVYNEHQKNYVQAIERHDITFGLGPAGTGKTFLAIACAIAALKSKRVEKIILVRPVVEAGEHLGFLPGDINQKIDPYLIPLYDALNELLGTEEVEQLTNQQIIQIAPLAYMRGRTLNKAFVILDEAQNTTQGQMKMFLTRLGTSSKMVITGDLSQIDLSKPQFSGLKEVVTLLKDIPGICLSYFDARDVVRHPLIQKILDAYANA